MKLKTLLIIPFIFVLTACGGGGTDSGGGSGLITFTIILNANCAGRVGGSVDIIFDGRNISTLTPGDSTTIETTVGQHTIEGLAANGGSFGPIERVLEFSGGSQTLNCGS